VSLGVRSLHGFSRNLVEWHVGCSPIEAETVRTMGYREHRKAFRIAVSGGVCARLLAPERAVELKDIGSGGFLVHSPVPIPLATRHQVEFSTSDGWRTTLTARSVHSRFLNTPGVPATHAVGFAFVVDAAERTDEAVAQLIDRVTAVLSFD
jgi:hypothetical protein